jgi:hypothetical protein
VTGERLYARDTAQRFEKMRVFVRGGSGLAVVPVNGGLSATASIAVRRVGQGIGANRPLGEPTPTKSLALYFR